MKNVFNFIKNFFVEKGLLKIIIAFVFLIISVLVLRTNPAPTFDLIFKWIGLLSLAYLGLVFVIFLIVGIVGAIKGS
jgi:hypothetical protein